MFFGRTATDIQVTKRKFSVDFVMMCTTKYDQANQHPELSVVCMYAPEKSWLKEYIPPQSIKTTSHTGWRGGAASTDEFLLQSSNTDFHPVWDIFPENRRPKNVTCARNVQPQNFYAIHIHKPCTTEISCHGVSAIGTQQLRIHEFVSTTKKTKETLQIPNEEKVLLVQDQETKFGEA